MKKKKKKSTELDSFRNARETEKKVAVVVPSNYIRLLRVQLFIFSWWVYSFAWTSARCLLEIRAIVFTFIISPSLPLALALSLSPPSTSRLARRKGEERETKRKRWWFFFPVCISFLSFLCAFVCPPLVNTQRQIRISHCSSERSPTSIDSLFLLPLSLSSFSLLRSFFDRYHFSLVPVLSSNGRHLLKTTSLFDTRFTSRLRLSDRTICDRIVSPSSVAFKHRCSTTQDHPIRYLILLLIFDYRETFPQLDRIKSVLASCHLEKEMLLFRFSFAFVCNWSNRAEGVKKKNTEERIMLINTFVFAQSSQCECQHEARSHVLWSRAEWTQTNESFAFLASRLANVVVSGWSRFFSLWNDTSTVWVCWF